jgi:enoyl-CoA hydratase/carnithine racemase
VGIGINRPYIHNRIDPETYAGLARAYYQYDHDPSLRAAVLFGHGDNFSRGIDVDAFATIVTSGRARRGHRAHTGPEVRNPR